jgi:hypothetical protein
MRALDDPEGPRERRGGFAHDCATRIHRRDGFVARAPFVPLGAVKQKSGKTVHAFACEGDFDPAQIAGNTFEIEWPPKSGRREEFPEIDRVEWFALATARVKILTYQLPLLAELERVLARALAPHAFSRCDCGKSSNCGMTQARSARRGAIPATPAARSSPACRP